jgi:flagellar hook-associated protein 1 FlgK
MSILSTLSIGAQSLKAQQLAIQTTGHNLANVATPGFSRQRVELVAAFPSFAGGVVLGQGVDAASVQRVIDRFTEAELLSLHRQVGYSEAESGVLTAVQEVFPLSGGVTGALGEFFNALSDLASNPAGAAERVNVIAKARAVGDHLALARQSLTSIQINIDKDLQSAVERVNILTEQIARLNGQISFVEVRGEPANDFRDQRQTLLQELTSLTGATFREDVGGQVTVLVDGLLLVGGERFATLNSDSVNANGFHSITYQNPDGAGFDASTLFSAGEIGALLNARDRHGQDVIDRIDRFAQTMVGLFNTQHALGFDLNGNAGGNLFAPIVSAAGAAAAVRVDAGLAADPRLIAAAQAANTLPGDNRNILALVGLRSTAIPALGGLTLEDHFLSLIADLGAEAQASQSRYEFQQGLLTQTQGRRESVSGVSIDEEMTKLIQFQRAFEASSMLVRSADEMYQALIEMAR